MRCRLSGSPERFLGEGGVISVSAASSANRVLLVTRGPSSAVGFIATGTTNFRVNFVPTQVLSISSVSQLRRAYPTRFSHESAALMAHCLELTSIASCSGRINEAFVPKFQSECRSNSKLQIARVFAACRVERSYGAIKHDGRKWRIRGTEIAASAEELQRFYATCERGLEEILAAELSSPLICASQIELGFGGVSFVGTQTTGYNSNLWLRTGARVLCELARGTLPENSHDRVYDFVRAAADWRLILVDDDAPQAGRFRRFAVEIRLQNFAGDQRAVSTSVSNAISDSLRDACGDQWPRAADREDAVRVQLVFHVDRDTAVLYRDMSGGAKQGYAQSKDGLAAAVLTIAGWNPTVPGFGEANKNAAQGNDRVLLDPFCGTGTLLIHAALMASNVAPGLLRQHWPFQGSIQLSSEHPVKIGTVVVAVIQKWHDYDERAWTQCRETAASMQVSSLSGARLIGNDMNDGAIAKCKRFAKAVGVLHLLELSCEISRHYQPKCTPSLVVTHPPCSPPLTYSSLRGEDERLLTLWRGFGQFLKSQCRGADVYVLSENDWLAQAMQMVPDRKWEMQGRGKKSKSTGRRNERSFGSLELKLLHYHVQPRGRAQGDPLSLLPFSSLSPQISNEVITPY